MVVTVWLVLFLTFEPPTFKVVEVLDSQQQCLEAKAAFVKEEHVSKEFADKLTCLTLATGVIKDA